MTAVRQALQEPQLDLIMEALEAKRKKHDGLSRSIGNSGYGRGSTEEKAKKHAEIAEECRSLMSYLTEEWN